MEARNYKDRNFSVAFNDRLHGIELKFENKMSDDDIADVKDAGFKWSKRQQFWYAYQTKKAMDFVNSLIENAETARESREDPQIQYAKEQAKAQKTIRENHEILQRNETITVNELAELVRQRNELDKRIAEIQKVAMDGKTVDVSSDQAKELLLATQGVEQSEPTVIDRVIPESEYARNRREEAEKTIEQIESERAANGAVEITEDDLKTAKKFIPTQEYLAMLGYANGGEESDFYKQKIKHVAEMGRILYNNRGGKSYNEETELHDKGFMHYYYGGSDFYICEVDGDGRAFGYTVLNGDTSMSEYGYTMLSEITSLGEGKFGGAELDLYIDDSVPMEHAINQKYPGLFAEEKEQEIENEQSLPNYIMSTSTKILNELNSNQSVSGDEKFKEMARRMKAALNAKKIDELSQEVYAALEDENYHTENHILGLMGYYGVEAKRKEIESYNRYPAGYTGMFNIENEKTIYEVAGVEQQELENHGEISPSRYDTIATTLLNDLLAGATEDYNEHLRDDLGISDNEINYLWSGPDSRRTLPQINDERMKELSEMLTAEAAESYGKDFSEAMGNLGINKKELEILLHENNENIVPVLEHGKATREPFNYPIENGNATKMPDGGWYNNGYGFDAENAVPYVKIVRNGEKQEERVALEKNKDGDWSYTYNGETIAPQDDQNRINAMIERETTKAFKPLSDAIQKTNQAEYEYGEFKDIDGKELFINNHLTPADMKKIREEAKRILSSHTDAEIREDGDMLSILAQYEGGGGLSNEKERTSAEVLNAFYTPRNVVEAVWKLADHYAPEAKTVLEPSSGIGRFAENRPNNQFTLRELDENSARIAKILHPEAEVIQGAFERQFFDADGRIHLNMMEPPKYDIVIGNPPYGENKSVWRGRGEGRVFARIEEYFLDRGLDSLKDENSVLLYVMPSSFLKSESIHAKNILATKGKIIDAYRLPNGAFSSTDVGTDIIVLKQNDAHKQIVDYDGDLEKMPEEKRAKLGKAVRENTRNFENDNWFKAHPEKILGEEYAAKDRWGKDVVMVRPHEGKTLQDELDEIGKQLKQETLNISELPKATYYVRTNSEFNSETVAKNLTAKEAVRMAVELTEQGKNRPDNGGTAYGVAMHIPGDLVFDDPEQESGFMVVNNWFNNGAFAVDNTIFDQNPGKPAYIAARKELEEALYEISPEYQKKLESEILANDEKLKQKETSARQISQEDIISDITEYNPAGLDETMQKYQNREIEIKDLGEVVRYAMAQDEDAIINAVFSHLAQKEIKENFEKNWDDDMKAFWEGHVADAKQNGYDKPEHYALSTLLEYARKAGAEIGELTGELAMFNTKQIHSLSQEIAEKAGLQKSFNGFYVRAKESAEIIAQDLNAEKAASLAYSLAWEAVQNGSKTQYEIYARSGEAMLISDDELKGFRVANQLSAESAHFAEDVTTLYNTKNAGKETAELYKRIERELNAALSEENERQLVREYEKNVAPLAEAVFKENPLFDLTRYERAWRNAPNAYETKAEIDALEKELGAMMELDAGREEKQKQIENLRAEYDARTQQKENARKELDEKEKEHRRLMHEKILLLEGVYKDNNVPWTVLESLHGNASKAIDNAYETIRATNDDGETDYLEDFEKPEVQNRLYENRVRKLAAEAVLHERNPRWLLRKVAAREVVQDQKLRTYNFWQKTKSTEELAKYIKNEFGQGGSGSSDSYYEDHSGKGIKITLNKYESDFNERKTTSYTWTQVANAVKDLIESNSYLTEEELRNPRLQTATPYAIAENDNIDEDEENEIDSEYKVEPATVPEPYSNTGEFTKAEFDKMKAAISDEARRNVTDTFGTIENKGKEYLVHIVHTADEEKRFAVYGDDAEYSCTITPTHLDLENGYESFVQFARDKINDTLGIGFSIDDEEYLNRLSEAFDENTAMYAERITQAQADAQEFYDDSVQKENGYSFKEYAAGQMAVGFILEKFPEVQKFDAEHNIGFALDEIGTKIAAGEIIKENLQSELDKLMQEQQKTVVPKSPIIEKMCDVLESHGFEMKWDEKSFSLQWKDGQNGEPWGVSTTMYGSAEELLNSIISEAENFNVDEFADDIHSEELDRDSDFQRYEAFEIASIIEADLSECVPELKKIRRDIFIEKGLEPLSQEEAAVVEKLAERTKMDGWLSVDEDGYIYDLDNEEYLDVSEIAKDFKDGVDAVEDNLSVLNESEKKTWNNLVIRAWTKNNGEQVKELRDGLDKMFDIQQITPQNPIAQKNPGDTLSIEEFSRLYGKEFDRIEFDIWKATDWEGKIDVTKLIGPATDRLLKSPNYVEAKPGEFTHKALFVSGNIGAKIRYYEETIEKVKNGEEIPFERDGDIFHYKAESIIENYQKNIAILQEALPKPIPMEKLHFGLNTTIAEEFKIPETLSDGGTVDLNLQEKFVLWAQGLKSWQEVLDDRFYYRTRMEWATANVSREEFPDNVYWHDIIEYIDKKPVKAQSTSKRYGMTDEDVAAMKAQRKREADEKRMARAETADRLFDRFLHEGLTQEEQKLVEAEYNKRFNSYIAPDYSKLPLFIDGMSAFKDGDRFKLYDQQIKGISFCSNKGNGLLAYDVGVGKTAAGIVLNNNQLQLERSGRPLVVVPNSVYTKWYNDFRELFPNVPVNDLYNLNKESTEKFRDKENPHKLNIPEGSVSLITYEGLKNITFWDETCENELYEDFSRLLSEDVPESGMGDDRNSTQKAKDAGKITNAIGTASQVKNPSYVFFEDCGWDNITVDEAHNFKNLWTIPRPKNKGESNEFSGIPTGKPSQRALKLYAMTQYVQKHNDNRNVFLLTATPFTNSPLEVYSMLSYIGRQRLIDSGIYSLRDFLNQFAHTKLEIAVNARGEIDYKQVMKDWKELPALQNILTEFIDKVDGEEAGIIRPKKFTHVKDLDPTDLQKKMIEADTDHMLEIKEGNSAAVIVSMNAMRLALVAPALGDRTRYDFPLPSMEQLVETSPKLKFVCDSIIEMYKTNPEKGQFMYMPLGQQAHGIVKDYLVQHGIPKEAVEVINGSVNNSVEKKEKITSRFNDEKDKLKIIIGGKNTSEGIDLNGNSFVMYNCSLGWNPSETIQAEGRIWRQGNMQGHVHCVYPVMNDSIDSVLYQKHDEKRSRINDLWTYKGDNLNVEDIKPEDLKFDLIKDPRKRAKLVLDEMTKELKAELQKTKTRIESYDEVVEKKVSLKEQLEEAQAQLSYRENLKKDYEPNGLEVPSWLKMEIAEAKKNIKSATAKMETVQAKLDKLGIHSDDESAAYIRNLNVQKHELEKQIEMKQNELPDILKQMKIELMEKKLTLPPVEEQRKELCADITSNLRPMKEVEVEIKQQRFEKMLEDQFQHGEITKDEFDLYKSAGYKNYEKWREGEIESLENIPEETFEESLIEATLEEQKPSFLGNQTITVEPVVSEKPIERQGNLFEEEYLDSLSPKQNEMPQEKDYRLIIYTSESGFQEKGEFESSKLAKEAGAKFMREWNLTEAENGFVTYNAKQMRIGGGLGMFPIEQYFSKKVLWANGMATPEQDIKETKVSDIAQAVKEKIQERTDASDEWVKNHLIIASAPQPKKQAAGMEY